MPRRPTGVKDEVRGAATADDGVGTGEVAADAESAVAGGSTCGGATTGAGAGGATTGAGAGGGATGRAGCGTNRCTGGGAGARAGVGMAGRGTNAGRAAGAAAGVGGRGGDETALDSWFGDGGANGGRAWVVRGVGDSGVRETPGTGGVNLGMSGGRATGCATGGVAGVAGRAIGGAMGGRATLGLTGVTVRAGVGGGISGGALASALAASGSEGTSPLLRLALATTPGVNIGVGFRRCGGGANGVANGIEVLGADGVATRGTSIDRLGEGGSNASGAASASDSMTARSFAAQAVASDGMAAETRAGVGAEPLSIPTRITAPHTEQRARTPPGGTFDGSTRNTD